jgi:hypothetical protein
VKPEPSALKEIAGSNYSAKWDFFTQKSKFSKFRCYIKYSKNESKIKITPRTNFLQKIKCRAKLF